MDAAPSDRVLGTVQATERGSAVLPIGVPLAAPPWQEARLLAALERLESERRMMDFPVR